MTDEPNVIRINIRHFEALLQLPCTEERRHRILKLLADARVNLVAAERASNDNRAHRSAGNATQHRTISRHA